MTGADYEDAAYYELIAAADPIGEKFSASDHVLGNWGSNMQNGAPVSALLVRSLERCAPRDDARLSRVVIDLLGAVPAGDQLWTRARVDRAGAKIELLSAEMLALGPDGQPRPVANASAWRFGEHDSAELAFSPTDALRPRSEARKYSFDEYPGTSYLHSLDWRWLNNMLTDLPGECWAKPVVDLVKGETMTPMERLFAVADVANGMGARIDGTEWTYLNTDLAVHVHRVPVGEWVGVRAETHYGPDGVGTSVGTLFDETGPVGHIQQAQLLRRRAR